MALTCEAMESCYHTNVYFKSYKPVAYDSNVFRQSTSETKIVVCSLTSVVWCTLNSETGEREHGLYSQNRTAYIHRIERLIFTE